MAKPRTKAEKDAKKSAKQQKKDAKAAQWAEAGKQLSEMQRRVGIFDAQIERLQERHRAVAREHKVNNVTLSFLKDTCKVSTVEEEEAPVELEPGEVRFWGQVGKMFVKQSYSEIKGKAEREVQDSSQEIPKLNSTLVQFEVRRKEALESMKEIVKQARQGSLEVKEEGKEKTKGDVIKVDTM